MARTRFQRADQADSDCTPASDANKPLLSAQTGGNEIVTASIAGQTMNATVFAFTMAAGDPGGGEDLAAASLFRCQIDVTVAGSSLTFKIRFRALDSICNAQANVDMGEADFTGVALHLGTASWDPPVSDRYQALVLVSHTGMMTDPAETITIRTNNANAFYEIPDLPAAGGQPTMRRWGGIPGMRYSRPSWN